jgi:hypothetical protein
MQPRTTMGVGVVVWGLWLFVFGATGHTILGSASDVFVNGGAGARDATASSPNRPEMAAGICLIAAGLLVCFKTESR